MLIYVVCCNHEEEKICGGKNYIPASLMDDARNTKQRHVM